MTELEKLEEELNKFETQPFLLRRYIAGFIDYFIIWILTFIYIQQYGDVIGAAYHIHGWRVLIPMVFWFFLTVGVEQFFGATLGNLVVNLQPKSLTSETTKISFLQSFKRHLLDPIDMVFFGFVGAILIKNTNQNQRVGDLWAKTIVIEIKN